MEKVEAKTSGEYGEKKRRGKTREKGPSPMVWS